MRLKKLPVLFFLLVLFLFSCADLTIGIHFQDLRDLPPDSGGIHSSFTLGVNDSPYGYYAYVPGGYEAVDQEYPLLVFLHGSGERGNSGTNPDDLARVLVNGPPKLIEQGNWDPYFPIIVVSPQCHDSSWSADKIHNLITWIISRYRINLSRIYVTGLSMGGYGTYSYIGKYGDGSYAAAVVPICGSGSTSQAAQYKNIPLWAFHGLDDTTVLPSGSINMVNAINDQNPVTKARLTLYPGVGHNSWSRTYDGSGMGQESDDSDDFDISIYKWMLYYQKN